VAERRAWTLRLALGLAAWVAPPAADGTPLAPHPLSIAYLEVDVEADAALLRFRPQALTILEVEGLAVDADRDQALTREEVLQAWPQVRAYLESGLWLKVDGNEWRPSFPEPRFEALPEALGGAASPYFERLDLRAALPTASRAKQIELRYELFFEDGNPDHRAHLTVRGLDAEPRLYLLSAEARRASVERQAPFATYLRLGFGHVLGGHDHLAFLLGLLLGVAGLGSLLAAVTAFTLAHSLTLALSALGVLSLSPAIVEPGIAFSVLAVVWMHASTGPARARVWIPAFAFGLLHGFGFAGILGEIGLPPGARAVALIAFNLGVEAGQLAFVLPVALLGAAGGAWLRRGHGAKTATRVDEARVLAATLLGAFALHLVAVQVAAAWLPGAFAGLPETLRGLPAALVAGAGTAALLTALHDRRGRQPRLAPAAGTALLLYALFVAGRWLGGVVS